MGERGREREGVKERGERQTKRKSCVILLVRTFFNYNRDCIDVSGHMSSIIYQGGVGSANKAFLRNPSSPRAWNHTLSKVNIVNAALWRDPLTNHGNDFLVSTCMRW